MNMTKWQSKTPLTFLIKDVYKIVPFMTVQMDCIPCICDSVKEMSKERLSTRLRRRIGARGRASRKEELCRSCWQEVCIVATAGEGGGVGGASGVGREGRDR